jgi:hypothetical protein
VTTAEHFRAAVTLPASTVSVAGVPWPAYKLIALLVGLLVFGLLAVTTAAAAPAVLGGSAIAALCWVGLGLLRPHTN